MAGPADDAGAGVPGRSKLLWLIVVAVVAVLAISATWYVVVNGGLQPNAPPHGLSIQVTPSTGNNTTVFHFTAQAADDRDPASALRVRWDWEDDGIWDTPLIANKTADHVYFLPGTYTVRLEVEDTGGLRANTTTQLQVSATNRPPRIQGIAASPSKGTNATTFTFTATVTDDHDPVSAIQVRWDWESDGTWDTNWSTAKVASHKFGLPGNYTVGLQARDTAALVSYASLRMSVGGPSGPPPPLRIGTILSLTGVLSAYGVDEQNGVTMAVAEINANGGVFGQPIQQFNLDDQTNQLTAAQDANTLVNVDQVAAIIGSTGSGLCAEILPIAASGHVMEIAPSCTSPLFSNLSLTGGWFARTVPSDALQAVVAASYLYANLSYRYAAVIGINNAYGIGTAYAFAQNFTRLGGTMTSPPRIVDEVFSGVVDYTPDLVAVLDTNPAPQVVYVVAYPPDGVLMMKNWWVGIAGQPAWANVNWTFSEGLYDQANFIAPLVTSGVNVSRFQGTAPAPYAGIEPPAYGAWAARYQTAYGTAPTLFAANAYDAAYLVALAAEASGNTTGWGVRSGLRTVADAPGTVVGPDQWALAVQELGGGAKINYNGASGSVDVGAHGDVPGSFVIWGVNATNQVVTREFFNESLVVLLSPPNTYTPRPPSPSSPLAAVWSREPGL